MSNFLTDAGVRLGLILLTDENKLVDPLIDRFLVRAGQEIHPGQRVARAAAKHQRGGFRVAPDEPRAMHARRRAAAGHEAGNGGLALIVDHHAAQGGHGAPVKGGEFQIGHFGTVIIGQADAAARAAKGGKVGILPVQFAIPACSQHHGAGGHGKERALSLVIAQRPLHPVFLNQHPQAAAAFFDLRLLFHAFG